MTNYFKTALLLGLLTGLILVIGQMVGGSGGMLMALVFAAVMNFAAYFFSDKIALASYGAKQVTREQAPDLFRIVENLCQRASLPLPRIYVIPSEAANAFATGRNPQHAAVAVTEGIMRLLNYEELEGVIAHELGHVQNRDILISSVAATLAGAIMWIAHTARFAALFGGFGNRDDRDEGGGALGYLFTIIVAPIAAMLIQMAVSRSREYGADATGAHLAGNPYGLARALEKLHASSSARPLQASPATSHLFIVNPFSAGAIMNLFSTHPPVKKRIERLLGRSGTLSY
ncbi:MAG: zinc metalloprotease HtpX [Acidobacteria bacterium]|nr:zinc metalloprotease HtpX [Acidobacteriota bacterium]